MSCSPTEVFEVAQRLSQSEKHEAGFRAVANRAYYAAFQAALAYHEALSLPGEAGGTKGTHHRLISQLENPGISRVEREYLISRALAKELRKARHIRVLADYRPEYPFHESNSDDALVASQTIIKRTLNSQS